MTYTAPNFPVEGYSLSNTTQHSLSNLDEWAVRVLNTHNRFLQLPAGAMYYDADYQKKRQEAEERSIGLLRSWLTPEQLDEYDRSGSFLVRGSNSNKRYRITSPTVPFNVWEINDEDQIVLRWCFVPKGGVTSTGDILLAQKIMLETDEPGMLALANHDRPRPYYDTSGA